MIYLKLLNYLSLDDLADFQSEVVTQLPTVSFTTTSKMSITTVFGVILYYGSKVDIDRDMDTLLSSDYFDAWLG